MLDPESMVAEQVIDKYVRVIMSLFRTNMDSEADEEFLTQLEGTLQIGKGMFLMSEMAERVAKQYGMERPDFPWTDQDR